MGGKNQYNYDELKAKVIEGLRLGVPARWHELAEYAGVNRSTLRSGATREWKIKDLSELLIEANLLSPDVPPTKLGTKVTEGVNTLEIDHVAGLVTTLDEALKKSKTDLNTWKVRDHQINFWPLGMKLKDEQGKEIPYAMQLCQVKVWLMRKVLVPIMPMIQPVEIRPPPVRVRTPSPNAKNAFREGRVKRALVVADPQVGFRRRLHSAELVPFHDRRVLDLALQISLSEPFDSLEVIGDCLDLSEWSSKFTPEPEFYWTTQPALIEWAWWLAQFGHVRQKRELEGNHEKRMRDLVGVYAKAAYGLRAVDELELPPALSVERLMAFHTLGVEYVQGYPDNGYWLNKNVYMTHGSIVRAGPGDTAKAVVNKSTYSVVFGHVHRRELVSRRIKSQAGDIFQTAFCPGCACHIDGRVPGSKSDDQWQNGLAVIEYTEDSETIYPIPIENGRAIYKGQVFAARERDKEIDGMLMGKLAPPAPPLTPPHLGTNGEGKKNEARKK